MTAGARAKRAEANEDLEYSISTLISKVKLLLDEMKERQREKGVNENLIAIGLSHSHPCSMLDALMHQGTYGILGTDLTYRMCKVR